MNEYLLLCVEYDTRYEPASSTNLHILPRILLRSNGGDKGKKCNSNCAQDLQVDVHHGEGRASESRGILHPPGVNVL